MLYSLEMPSFDIDDSPGPSPTLRGPAFEPLTQLRNSHEKTNGAVRSQRRRSTKGSLDHSPDHHSDSPNGACPVTNGEMNGADGGLGSLPNGRLSTSSRDAKSNLRNETSFPSHGAGSSVENLRKNPHVNGNSNPVSTGSDSTAPINGVQTNGHAHQGEPQTRSLLDEENDLTTEFEPITIPPPISTNPQSTGPLTYNSNILPSSPSPEPPARAATVSSHRFSSPPSYQAPSTGTSGSAPSGSATGSFQPVAPPLKHRHTLQVPKVVPGRSSRDGADDAVFASGRFSPTTAARRGSLSLARRNTRSIHSDMPHEEVPQDEDAARWAEAIRQKRASKRRRKDEEDDDRVVVGTKVDMNHVNWVTAYNMLTGIRFTVSRTNAKLDRALTEQDFEARHKFSFDITGNELTPSAKYDFKFKDYAPWVFRSLRAKFKLDPADYLMSLTSKYILSELGSPGKSGSFFYFSRDYKYIIKTIHHAEHKFLRKILKDYYYHVQENPNTLLSQFYGLHRVKIPYGRKIHFVVMNNLFPPHRDIHQTFDLKGSTIGRDFKEEDLEKNPRATLKDLNWLRRNLHLEFGPEKKRLFIEQMERDVRLMQKLKIMDYSLLVGVHDLERGNQENLRDKTLQVFQPGGETSVDDSAAPPTLARTPSKLETARKARELRQIIKQEKPIPMGQALSRMPDQLEENATKKEFTFYSDDGGFQATHDDNSPGDEIYYLGIIDCLTHYGMVKRLEHFWKGLSQDKQQISPVPSVPYGDRFIKFISGVTKTREQAEVDVEEDLASTQLDASNNLSDTAATTRRRSGSQHMQRTHTDNTVIQMAEVQAQKSEDKGGSENHIPERTLHTVRSPSTEQERQLGERGMTLPIVDEVGESSSTGGRSGQDEKDERPPTPPKDTLKPDKQQNSSGVSSRGNSFDSNKALPPLPNVNRDGGRRD